MLRLIISVREDGYAVKGDANDFVDAVRPTRDQVVGELWLVVPGAGSFVSWLQRPLNALALVLLAVFIALLGGREATRRTRIPTAVSGRARRPSSSSCRDWTSPSSTSSPPPDAP